MITPPYLKPGDTIAVVGTARKVSKVELQPTKAILESWGLTVQYGKNLFKEDNYFAGNDLERAADLQKALDNKNVKAILFARGGYGTVRIIDTIQWKKFTKNPKWLIGFSDITVLHSHVHAHCEVETLHSPMGLNIPKLNTSTLAILRETLMGNSLSYTSGKQNAVVEKLNRKGIAQGQLVGGNLSILYSLAGTASDINMNGKILFIEDLDEYFYHIDRMMMSLKRNNKLNNLAGLIVGAFTDIKDNDIAYGKTAEEIILSCVKEFNYPITFGFPVGHIPNNVPLIMGRWCELEVGEKVHLRF